jgi:two-component system sensor histidine kinase AtoS
MRLLAGTVLVIAVLMLAVIVVVDYRQRLAIVDEVDRRGEVLGRHLAAISYVPLLLYNFTALEQNVARVAAEADVVYAIVLDAEGRVAAHSRHPERVGFVLNGDAAAQAVRADELLVQSVVDAASHETVYDFAVPVHVDRQRWGTVRVGLSRHRMDAIMRRTRRDLGLLTLVTLLGGGVAAALVARRIARPLGRLADSAAAISRGELDQRIEPSTKDEVGQLAIVFNHMAAQLLQQRTALEAAHAELRRRFEELADLKGYTDNILASLTSGIVTVDLEGRVVTFNPAAEMLMGFFAGEVVGRYCTEVFAQTPEVGELLMHTLASRTGVGEVNLLLRRRNGDTAPVELTMAPLKGAEGKDLGVVGVFRDVTLVRELEQQLQRSDRLAALGTMAAGLAHEIKNPLTSLLTFSRHLERKFDDADFRAKFQRVVPRELERINGITERLLELSRPSRLAFALVRPAVLMERCLELYTETLESRDLQVVREYARDTPMIKADPDALHRAIVNLVANALEAMERGGRLTVRVGRGDAPLGVVPSRRRDHAVKIEIEDTGTGVAPGDADRIFTPFFTTKDRGTGLGLAITHKIVEDHGGTIALSSRPERGTLVTVLLPVASPRQGSTAAKEPRAAPWTAE